MRIDSFQPPLAGGRVASQSDSSLMPVARPLKSSFLHALKLPGRAGSAGGYQRSDHARSARA